MRELLKLIFKNSSIHPALTPIILLAATIVVSTVVVNFLLYFIDLMRN